MPMDRKQFEKYLKKAGFNHKPKLELWRRAQRKGQPKGDPYVEEVTFLAHKNKVDVYDKRHNGSSGPLTYMQAVRHLDTEPEQQPAGRRASAASKAWNKKWMDPR
jgi:hypothetical protein